MKWWKKVNNRKINRIVFIVISHYLYISSVDNFLSKKIKIIILFSICVCKRPLSEMTTDIENLPFSQLITTILYQNYPNPFNPTTKISFTLPKPEHITLDVYNTLGQKVATLLIIKMIIDSHDVQFDASNLPSGIYFYRVQAGEFSQVRKMVLMQ